MKKSIYVITGICLLVFIAGTVFAQGDPSAKFAAAYSSSNLIVESDASACAGGAVPYAYQEAEDKASDVILATMKMPQGKEILAGISAQSKIILDTKVSGKNGGKATADALGKVAVRIKAVNVDDPTDVYFPVPSKLIVLNMQQQVLDATLGGVIESCNITVDELGVATPVNIAEDCVVTDEEIGLFTKSQSANHFNVVFVDMPQGTYHIKARFTVLSQTSAEASVYINTEGDPVFESGACADAYSKVVLGNRIVTLQDVRAVKDEGIVDFTK